MFPAARLGSRTKGTALLAASGEGRSPLVWRLRLLCLGYRGALCSVCGSFNKADDYRHLAAVSDDWSQKSRGNYASRRPWR